MQLLGHAKKITICLVIDESGDKGYSNSTPSEGIGVMAGFLIEDGLLPILNSNAESLINHFSLNKNKKLHMRDLDENDRENAIKIVKKLFFHFNIKFFYTVIATKSYSSYVGNDSGTKKELMHSQLLQNTLQKAMLLCRSIIEKNNSDVIIKIISDNVDSGVIKKIEKDIERPLNVLNSSPNRLYHKKGEYIESTIINMSHDFRPKNGKFEVDINVENSPITFIADVLANTTFKHLIKIFNENNKTALNTIEITKEHPLQEFIFLQFDPEKHETNIEDILFGPGRKEY